MKTKKTKNNEVYFGMSVNQSKKMKRILDRILRLTTLKPSFKIFDDVKSKCVCAPDDFLQSRYNAVKNTPGFMGVLHTPYTKEIHKYHKQLMSE